MELRPVVEDGLRTQTGHRPFTKATAPTSFPLKRGFKALFRSAYDYVYETLDPHVRPVVRTMVVTIFRFVIRALPTLVEALDFELESAVIMFSTDVDAKISIAKAKVDMNVALDQLGCSQASDKAPVQPGRHKRFASVANLNSRLKSSLKRTWDRAWGGTEVVASVCLSVSRVLVTTRDSAQDQSGTTIAGVYPAVISA